MAINRWEGVGNITREPELRSTQSGSCILTFGLAVNERRKNNQTGEWEDAPLFVDCVMFGTRAEKVSQFINKGSKIAVDGKLRYSSWEKDGQKRSKIDVVVNEVEFMSQKQVGGYSDRHSQARQEQAEYVQATYFDDDDLPW